MAVSQQICDRAKLLCSVHPPYVAADIIKVSRATIYRIRERGWEAARYEGKRRPIPTDFAIQARFRTTRELARYYHAGCRVIARWLREKPRPRFKPGKVRQQESATFAGGSPL